MRLDLTRAWSCILEEKRKKTVFGDRSKNVICVMVMNNL
jgi:hypothetical protein